MILNKISNWLPVGSFCHRFNGYIQLILLLLLLSCLGKFCRGTWVSLENHISKRKRVLRFHSYVYVDFCRMDGFVGQTHQPDNQHKHIAQNSQPVLIHHVSELLHDLNFLLHQNACLPIYNNVLVVMVCFNPLIVALIHPPWEALIHCDYLPRWHGVSSDDFIIFWKICRWHI